jgi:PadR family transcriptional regulator PadR
MIGKELIKGMIKPIVLHQLLLKDRMYGYEITQSVHEQTAGKITLTLGALYPVLHKLEAGGELATTTEAVDNRLRKYYRLTRQGRKTALQKTGELSDFIDALHQLWHHNPGTRP